MGKFFDTKKYNQEGIMEYLESCFPDSLLADGFDSCIIGVTQGTDSGRVVYDVEKMIEVCMEDGMTYSDAYEYLEYNTLCAYVGEYTPVYIEYLAGEE
jgi:hypothetical protein